MCLPVTEEEESEREAEQQGGKILSMGRGSLQRTGGSSSLIPLHGMVAIITEIMHYYV